MKRTRCYTRPDGAYPIHLDQVGKDNFIVTYGLQVKDHLTYSQAAKELGCCIMHSLACEGELDNRHKGEK
jgi:hypothetical protein